MPNALPIPNELTALIENGLWPRNSDDALRQNLHCLISEESIRLFAPEESKIYFYPAPFCTVRQEMTKKGTDRFWSASIAAIQEIDPDKTLIIGDFGLGSDSPLALEYRPPAKEPRVIRLKWAQEGNHWAEVAPSFSQFTSYLRKSTRPEAK